MVRALRAVDAGFQRRHEVLVPPFSIELAAGDRATLAMTTGPAASIAARMAAGIVKATTGTLFIGDFDPRIQPVQAKRTIGFVPRSGRFGGDAPRAPLSAACVREIVDLHAALYEVEQAAARRAAFGVLSAFSAVDDATLALALALIRPIALLVLDRPEPALAARLEDVVPQHTAVVSTAGSVAFSQPAIPAEAAR